MNIATKADIGQKVYVMHQEQIKEVCVKSINVNIEGTDKTVRYKINKAELNGQPGTESYFEHEVYNSIEELTKDLKMLVQYLPKPKAKVEGIDELSQKEELKNETTEKVSSSPEKEPLNV